MNRKSITCEYFALATDKNGMMPPMRKDESNAGMAVAGFMDLLLGEVITVEKKKITVIKELPEELGHISVLYNYLKEKPRVTDKLMTDFYTGSKLNQLTTDIGETLLADEVVSKGSGGIFGPKTTYTTEQEYKDGLISIIKSAITKADEITPHDVALIYILQGSKNLNQYFSKDEFEQLKTKLKEMKKDPQYKQLTEMINYVSEMITMIITWVSFYSLN